MTDFSKTNIHCSCISLIMTSQRKKTNMQLWREAVAELTRKEDMYAVLIKKSGPRGAKLVSEIEELQQILIPKLEAIKNEEEPLSDSCKSHLSQVYAYQKYGKWSISKEIGNKATQKGKEVEPDSIALVSELEDVYFEKNAERIENGWFTGIPDFYEGETIFTATKIHDVKSPWDMETYISNVGKTLSYGYYWQMQGYMDLTGAKSAEVHFCLVNQPLHLIKREIEKLQDAAKIIDRSSAEAILLEAEVWNNLTFDDVPKKERRIKFIVERDDEAIELAHKRVEKCREYLVEFEKLHTDYDFTASLKKIDLDERISA